MATENTYDVAESILRKLEEIEDVWEVDIVSQKAEDGARIYFVRTGANTVLGEDLAAKFVEISNETGWSLSFASGPGSGVSASFYPKP